MKLIIFIALALPGFAQAGSPSPYAGEESRQIKALSPSEQADLLSGKGMGLAKAAELNGYPGPAHVLELAPQLELSAEQLATTRSLFASMEQQAKDLGRQLVEAEHSLDTQFASRQITAQQMDQSLAAIGGLQARIRSAHLVAHIEQERILSAEQNAMYAKLRGYERGSEPSKDHEQGHQH
ncbi:MAG: hypothetical protein M3Z20_12185 [Chloroflexota bacterium]|nr:hypothetical protein [Chloroflexota bacterium]